MTDFWIIMTGILVAVSCSIIGCFLVLRKMAMLGDAISHSVLPGIVIAFLIQGSRDSFLIFIGAAILGLITVFLIQLLKSAGVQSDASIGVVFTALFAIGIVLISLFTRHIDLDLECVLFGEIAYVPFHTLEIGGMDIGPKSFWVLSFALLLIVLVIGLFYKQFKITTFDPGLAFALGIPVALFHYLLMGLVSVTTVAAFESVGVILVVGMLVVPSAAAYLLTERLGRMIVCSIVIGSASAVLGYGFAFLLDVSISGSMVTVAGMIFLAVLIYTRIQDAMRRTRNLSDASAS